MSIRWRIFWAAKSISVASRQRLFTRPGLERDQNGFTSSSISRTILPQSDLRNLNFPFRPILHSNRTHSSGPGDRGTPPLPLKSRRNPVAFTPANPGRSPGRSSAEQQGGPGQKPNQHRTPAGSLDRLGRSPDEGIDPPLRLRLSQTGPSGNQPNEMRAVLGSESPPARSGQCDPPRFGSAVGHLGLRRNTISPQQPVEVIGDNGFSGRQSRRGCARNRANNRTARRNCREKCAKSNGERPDEQAVNAVPELALVWPSLSPARSQAPGKIAANAETDHGCEEHEQA